MTKIMARAAKIERREREELRRVGEGEWEDDE